MSALIGIDQGTTGTRVVAFGEGEPVLADDYREVPTAHPHPGWVEKDADAVVASVAEGLAEVAGQLGGAPVAAVGLDNEGETVVAWDAETLRPLAPAIVWSCRRSQGIVDRLRAAGAEPRVRALAGTPLDPYFSSTKIRWLLENDAAVARPPTPAASASGHSTPTLRTARRRRPHRPSTAARTQLQRLDRPGDWDEELCAIFGVRTSRSPRCSRRKARSARRRRCSSARSRWRRRWSSPPPGSVTSRGAAGASTSPSTTSARGRLAPNAADLRNELGRALADAGRADEAIVELRAALRLDRAARRSPTTSATRSRRRPADDAVPRIDRRSRRIPRSPRRTTTWAAC